MLVFKSIAVFIWIYGYFKGFWRLTKIYVQVIIFFLILWTNQVILLCLIIIKYNHDKYNNQFINDDIIIVTSLDVDFFDTEVIILSNLLKDKN